MIRLKNIAIIFLAFAVHFCDSNTAHLQEDVMKIYLYQDGAGNLYEISPTSIVYSPVRPENSSTGFYSGGKPASAIITPAQFDSLEKIFLNAIQNHSESDGARAKGTGLLALPNNKKYVFPMHSPEQKQIETALLSVKSKVEPDNKQR